jgi:hypothetical protein
LGSNHITAAWAAACIATTPKCRTRATRRHRASLPPGPEPKPAQAHLGPNRPVSAAQQDCLRREEASHCRRHHCVLAGGIPRLAASPPSNTRRRRSRRRPLHAQREPRHRRRHRGFARRTSGGGGKGRRPGGEAQGRGGAVTPLAASVWGREGYNKLVLVLLMSSSQVVYCMRKCWIMTPYT